MQCTAFRNASSCRVPPSVTPSGVLSNFLRFASLSALASAESDSEDDRAHAVAMKSDLCIAVVAHNGAKFDFPFLVSECIGAGVDVSVIWRAGAT